MKRNIIRGIAALWLTVIVAYGYGLLSVSKNLWPYPQLVETKKFIAGHPEEPTTLFEKLANDTGMAPMRLMVPLPTPARALGDYRPFEGLPLASRRAVPQIFLSPDALRGYRVIVGTFDLVDTLHAVILIDPDGKLEHVWPISEKDLSWKHEPDNRLFPHGFNITPDGALIVSFDSGQSRMRVNWCGAVEWADEGSFHHLSSLDEHGQVWSWRTIGSNERPGYEQLLVVQSAADGRQIRTIRLLDILDANPDIDPFRIRQEDRAEGSFFNDEPFHPNDVEPLPSAWADAYPQFEAGDLLISFRSLNLLFVIDPDSLAVKWWRSGLVRRAHDPDWNPFGTITVLDNNMNRGKSRILEIDPKDMSTKVLVDGRDYDFYTWIRGTQQLLPNREVLVTSAQQGRVFEVDSTGKVTFSFRNNYDDQHGLVMSESLWLPEDFFTGQPSCSP